MHLLGIKAVTLNHRQRRRVSPLYVTLWCKRTFKQSNFHVFAFKYFEASTEEGAVVNNSLSPVISAQYIIIIPVECTVACALRVEFYGCYEGMLMAINKNRL